MSPTEIQNWVAFYLATAICCAFVITLSTASLGIEITRKRFWARRWTWRRLALFVPATWLRWQRRYFLSTPATLGIVGGFATTLS